MRYTEIRTNAPQEPNSFVGRERELDELRRLVGTTRALTLCGAGGIGKTRLALRVLAGVADDFPDGAWVVDLGDLRQPDLVVSRIASVIGVSEEPGRPLLETLADALASRQLLLALDNCEHLIESAASSIASGMPSRARHSAATTATLAEVTANPDNDAEARSANRRIAS